MTSASLSHIIYGISLALLAIGVYGATSTRSLLRMLLSIEVIFNGILLAIVAYMSSNPVLDTLTSIVIVSVVSGEVIIVVALIVAFYRISRTLESGPLEEEGV